MVKQARDQLESNQTQDDLRAVFEGSCRLIYVKPIVKECIHVVDDFIPELIEALASQMNPQVVCSVAGLCNNAHIDRLLEEAATPGKISSIQEEETEQGSDGFTCGKCSSIASQITTKFHSTKRDTVLENMLELCGQVGSFSDACSSIVVTRFNEIYDHLSKYMNPDGICHLSGTCSGKFHQHEDSEEIEIRPMSDVGYVKVKDDIPCELCEQLVNHLKDLLVANTTEAEFQQVLQGLCKQTHSFSDECLSIVNQYYGEIYEFLTQHLDSNGACFYIGVCPKGDAVKRPPIAPLVPYGVSLPQFYKSENRKKLGEGEPVLNNEEIQQFQLPIERLMVANPLKALEDQSQAQQLPIDVLMGAPNSLDLVNGGSWCTMCEYAMHFVQEEISLPKNEEEIKNAVLKTCNRMPKTIRTECDNFVDLYGDALIALLVQEADPATVCPQLKLCPSNSKQDFEVFAPSSIEVQVLSESSNKASCPLCLLAVEQAKQVIKGDKSIDKIKHTLENLCSHLKNKKLRLECDDFVETYSQELIDLLMNDFTPQEICVNLKLCTDQLGYQPFEIQVVDSKNREIETNEINDNTIDGIMISSIDREITATTPECLLCKDIIKEVEKRVVNKKSRAEIKQALEHACDKVPRKARDDCHKYVDKYGDKIVELIIEELSPKEICAELQLCSARRFDTQDDDLDFDDAVQVKVFTSPEKIPVTADTEFNRLTNGDLPEGSQSCVLCEIVITQMEKDLKKNATQDEIRNYIDHACDPCPPKYRQECIKFIDKYAETLIQTFEHLPPHEICKEMKLCDKVKVASKNEILDCAVCQGSVTALEVLVKDKQVDDDIENFLYKSCQSVPARYNDRVSRLIGNY